MNTGSTTPDDRPHTVSGYTIGPHRTDARTGPARRNDFPTKHHPPSETSTRPGRPSRTDSACPSRNFVGSRETPRAGRGPALDEHPRNSGTIRFTHAVGGTAESSPEPRGTSEWTLPPRVPERSRRPLTRGEPAAGTRAEQRATVNSSRKNPSGNPARSTLPHSNHPSSGPPQKPPVGPHNSIPRQGARTHESHRTAGSYYTPSRAPRAFPPYSTVTLTRNFHSGVRTAAPPPTEARARSETR
ncbi:hypothetical protein SAMN04489718_2862 [Actinopolyspora saharensis]|uniref:Uncharacterized protein n=1 Tax=Actinopolyspora saharensis TaxID=995062 RepID=A0A1H1F609_9ACTN|nr:hypothetical protein SAMN04489718_2862 [Actinopolyspora saharensis]